MTTALVQPGDFGLVRTHGQVSRLIGAAEWVDEMAQGHWRTADRAALYRHAFLVTDVDGNTIHAVEARPSGAGVAAYHLDDPAILWSGFELTAKQRHDIVTWGVAHRGDKYSCRAYLRQAAVRLHIPLAAALLARQIKRHHEEPCSQFVDCAYQAAGVELFADKRAPYDVAPSDLALLVQG